MADKPTLTLDENFLRELEDLPSPSGFEQPVQRKIRAYLEPFADELKTDIMGNVIASLSSSDGPIVMLDGHVDEVGMQIRYIDKNGFIFVSALGGIDPHLTPGSRVLIYTKDTSIPGLIGKKAIHLQEGDDRTKVVKLEKQFIDIGARTREEVEELGIRIGDPIIFENFYQKLGNNGDIVSRCFDDKVGAFIVAEVLKRLKSREKYQASVYGSFSVQEEVGLRGATVSSFSIHPDIAITYDVDFACDTPVVSASDYGDTKLGGGPILCQGPGVNNKLFDLIVSTAEELNIPIQIVSASRSTGTNSDAVQMTRGGVATAVISIPCRYMHSMSEVVNLYDVEQIIQLSVAVIEKISSKAAFVPK